MNGAQRELAPGDPDIPFSLVVLTKASLKRLGSRASRRRDVSQITVI